jgi:polysaccharide biosynthesis transport protein
MNSVNLTTAQSNSDKPSPFHDSGLAADSAPDNEEVIDLGQYWRTIMRHKWGIISVTLIGLIIGVLAAVTATPIYRANSTIKADPSTPNADPREQYISSALVFLYYETQYEIIRSRTIAENVVDKLDLVSRYKIQKAKDDKEHGNSKSLLETLTNWIPSTSTDTTEKKTISDAELRINIAQGIQADLDVKGGKQSQIIVISYDSPDAQEAADIVNTVADSFIEFGLSSRLGKIEKTAGWLGEQLTQLKTKLQDSENRLQTYRQQKGMVDTSQQQRIANTQMQTLNSELIRAQTRESEARILYRQVKSLKDQPGKYNSLSTVLNSKTIQDMVREDAQLRRKVQELSERYGEKHPKMMAARSDADSANDNLQREVNKIASSIEKQYRSATVQVSNIKSLINTQKQSIGSLQGANFTLQSLEREVENNRRIYESFLSRLLEADVSGQNDASNVQIIDTATVPKAPYKPNKTLFVALAGVMGVFLGVVLAFLREALDNTFKTPEAIEDKLKMPVLGLTQLIKANDDTPPEHQYLNDSRSPFAESINNIRTGLLFSNIDNPPQTILITSATGSEGKSTLAINLATALSQMDRTLLLEVDLRKPSIARYMQSQKRLGLCDLVAGQSKLQDVVSQANKESNLHIISCGTLPPNPLELLSSDRFEDVLTTLRSHYRYIVLDGPPTLPVSDSAIIGHLSDATILTVKAEDTTAKAAQEALGRLQRLGVKVTGAVLSQAEPHRMSYYGDHYYTGGYYGENPNDRQERQTNKMQATA